MPENKKLNILFLSSWYPNRLIPTLGNFVQKHAEAVAMRENVAALFVCSDPGNKEPFEVVESNPNNVYTVNVYYKKVQHSFPLIAFFQKASRYLEAHRIGLQLIRKKMPEIDLVHDNILFPSGFIAMRLKKKLGIPYIITENWTGYLPSKNTKTGLIQKFLSKKIAANAACITPVSLDLKKAMISHGFDTRYEIIYNVMDTKLFHPVKDKSTFTQAPEDKKIKFVHISTLDDPHKNISGMLRVAEKLSKSRTDFEMWFIGDGDTAPHIATAKKLNIHNNFAFFDGTKTTSEVAEIMRNADCFLMFSNYENLPCVMVEALASGIPVVSSTAGGIPEHITPEMGLLVKPMDEEGLMAAVSKAIDNIKAGKYDPEKLSNYALNNFSYEKIGKKFSELYHRILAAEK
jgi:glycosyltransferase involved in cell wall biosynthesis